MTDEPRTIFKVRYTTAPDLPHVYCQVFAAPAPEATHRGLAFAHLGSLTLRKQEFEHLRECFDADFVEDEGAGEAIDMTPAKPAPPRSPR
jgi:hypothetical protein